MDLSIIVVNWNTVALLRACLRSIDVHANNIDYEVIVVDNGSSDGSQEAVAADFPNAHLICNAENLGFARACNQGLRLAAGRYLFLLNSDTEVLGSALSTMVSFLDDHPNVGIVGASMRAADGTRQFSCSLAPLSSWRMLSEHALNTLCPENTVTKRNRVLSWTYDVPFEVDWVSGGALMIRRLTMVQVGLLDESFFMYTEDADWCFRAKKTGWKVFHLPDAAIYHRIGGSKPDQPQFSADLIRKGRIRFQRKHYGLLSSLGLRLLYRLGGPRYIRWF
jgi:GT2 family glycosyltransferase